MKNFKKNQLSEKDLQTVKGGGFSREDRCNMAGGTWLGNVCIYFY
jgi:natural product precursor